MRRQLGWLVVQGKVRSRVATNLSHTVCFYSLLRRTPLRNSALLETPDLPLDWHYDNMLYALIQIKRLHIFRDVFSHTALHYAFS